MFDYKSFEFICVCVGLVLATIMVVVYSYS